LLYSLLAIVWISAAFTTHATTVNTLQQQQRDAGLERKQEEPAAVPKNSSISNTTDTPLVHNYLPKRFEAAAIAVPCFIALVVIIAVIIEVLTKNRVLNWTFRPGASSASRRNSRAVPEEGRGTGGRVTMDEEETMTTTTNVNTNKVITTVELTAYNSSSKKSSSSSESTSVSEEQQQQAENVHAEPKATASTSTVARTSSKKKFENDGSSSSTSEEEQDSSSNEQNKL